MTVDTPRRPRINPANIQDLPSVLDPQQTADVLRYSIESVRELANLGLLHRLCYTSNLLFDAREVRRFLRWSTEQSREGFKQAVSEARQRLEGNKAAKP